VTRRPLPILAALLLAGCASGGGTTAPNAPATPPAPRIARTAPPNIVLILADDLDTSHMQYLPLLRKHLAARGTTFSNAFVTYPVCAPSRASILTGQYAHNHGVVENRPPAGSFRRFFEDGREASTIATWLRAAGYRTGLIGKYINRYPLPRNLAYVPPGWDDWRGYCDFISMAENRAYYEFDINENGRMVRYADEEKDYLTDVLRDKALDFIARSGDDQPFFLYLSPFAPHAPVQPAARHAALFPDVKAPRRPNFDEEDVSDKPRWVRELPRLTPAQVQATDEWFRKRIQSMQAVDEMVEAVVQALEARGLLEHTYLFFTSDNGFQFGGHRMDHGKGDPYDESIRVPLLVRGPGVAQGKQEPALALNIDLAPTFAAIAGASVPDSVDGRSLLRTLTGKQTLRDARSDFLVELRSKEDAGITDYAALRSAEHLYVEYDSGERELYDLRKDPFQLDSIAQSADPALLQKLAERLQKLRACKGDGCRS
jgi:arylsulfatase A-like enzyme